MSINTKYTPYNSVTTVNTLEGGIMTLSESYDKHNEQTVLCISHSGVKYSLLVVPTKVFIDAYVKKAKETTYDTKDLHECIIITSEGVDVRITMKWYGENLEHTFLVSKTDMISLSDKYKQQIGIQKFCKKKFPKPFIKIEIKGKTLQLKHFTVKSFIKNLFTLPTRLLKI